MPEYNIYAGTKRVSVLVPLERLEQRLAEIRNCFPTEHINAYRVNIEHAYHFDPKCREGDTTCVTQAQEQANCQEVTV